MKGLPYKIAGLLLILFSLTYGLWAEVPELPIIEQSIRNLFYHVSMWFAMVAMMAGSYGNAIRFLSSENMIRDRRSISLAEMGMFFSVMGLLTGMLWANIFLDEIITLTMISGCALILIGVGLVNFFKNEET